MTSQTPDETGADLDVTDGAGDTTLPADGDVVARIRAHAAKLRSGDVSAASTVPTDVVPLEVWTPESDGTVVFATHEPPEVEVPQHVSSSLVDGVSPPEPAVSFWDDRPFRASGIEAPGRRYRQSGTVPLWAWVAAVVVCIVVASLAISWVLATGVVAAVVTGGVVTP